ncbi:Uncharacterized conserved protein, DUF885 familyt [Goodfellowiella coeruleoviolacea]|uniref:Uncharacterized conserved protein, DUF885 familyt n=1 Tax=Goodfellowiella coeruleoviolacea TaxID=334858 RepID=A0AAE3GDY6_9PSEU|nr:Uncharacterized conserved protein, DUF885 familyt [Goodfellowiella coeruleoviolacea]
MTATQLADDLLEISFDAEPLTATLYGVRDRDDRLTDHSEAAARALRARLADVAARAAALDGTGLDLEDRITRAVVIQQAQAMQDHLAARAVEYTVVDSMFAPVGELLSLLPRVGLAEPEHARAYLARLGAIPEVLATLRQRHRVGIAANRVAVRPLVEATVAYLDRYLAEPANDPLRVPTPAYGDAGGPDGAAGGPSAAEFTAERDRLLTEAVYPAFAEYRDFLRTEVAPPARPADRPGLCWLPDGDTAYAGLVRAHTTTERSAEELHQTGLDLIDALAEEYRELGAKVFGTTDLAEIFRRLREDPALRWTSREELLDGARQAIARAERAAPAWFGRLPSQRCVVEPVPSVEEAGAVTAYYMPPAMDGTRPGTYFANTYLPEERYRYIAEAIAFHEAVPGHHFQISLAQEQSGLPMLRRIAPVTAYIEGWALYTERLADEMGLYSDDLSRLGMLVEDSMRAGRLVVDTGLHAKGWSRQRAVDYLSQHTAMAPLEIRAEVDRYISAPGQALSYMVGRLEIQRLRAHAERALGSRFDIRAFHDTVLGHGPLPLAVLAEVVDAWIAEH